MKDLGAISVFLGLVALAFSSPAVGVPLLAGAVWWMLGLPGVK